MASLKRISDLVVNLRSKPDASRAPPAIITMKNDKMSR